MINIIRVEQTPVYICSLQHIEEHSKIAFAWVYWWYYSGKINKNSVQLEIEQMPPAWTHYFILSLNQHVVNPPRSCLVITIKKTNSFLKSMTTNSYTGYPIWTIKAVEIERNVIQEHFYNICIGICLNIIIPSCFLWMKIYIDRFVFLWFSSPLGCSK